jgi:hypothetical protein
MKLHLRGRGIYMCCTTFLGYGLVSRLYLNRGSEGIGLEPQEGSILE